MDRQSIPAGLKRLQRHDLFDRYLRPGVRQLSSFFAVIQNGVTLFGNIIGNFRRRLVRLGIEAQVVDLQVDSQVLITIEAAVDAGAHAGAPDHKRAGAHLPHGKLLDLVGQNQGTGGKLVVIEVRNLHSQFHGTHMAVHVVFMYWEKSCSGTSTATLSSKVFVTRPPSVLSSPKISITACITPPLF